MTRKGIIKLLIGSILTITLMVVILVVFPNRQSTILADQIEKMYRHPLTVINAVQEVNAGILKIQLLTMDVVAAKSDTELESAIAEIENLERKVFLHFTIALDRFLGDKSKIVDTRTAFSNWVSIISRVIELTRLKKKSEALALLKVENPVYVTELSQLINGLIESSQNKASKFLFDSKTVQKESNFHRLLLVGVLLLFTGVVAFVVMFRVISTEKGLNENLAHLDHLERRFKGIFNAISDGIVLTDVDRRIIAANVGMKTTFGYEESELLGNETSILYENHDEFERQGLLRFNLSAEQKLTPYIVNYRHKDGHIFPAETLGTVIRGEEGKVISYLGVMRDITERNQFIKGLREQEWRYRSVVDSVVDAIIGINSHGDVMSWNRGAELIFEYTEKEILGEELTILMPERFREAHKAGIKRFLETGEKTVMGKTVELTAVKKNGSEFPIELTLGSWHGNEDIFFSGIIRDITERKEMEVILRQSQKMDALGNLAGGLAHDVNNMLLPIISLSEMTLKDLPEGSKAQKRLEKVVEAGVKARNLVSGILAFSHRVDGEVKKEVVNIAELCQETLNLLSTSFPATIKLKSDIDLNTGTVLCDPSQVSSILLNLASNAIDAMENNIGELKFSVTSKEVDAPPSQKLVNLKPGPYAKISVSDTGTGMYPDTLLQIFDPFFTTKQVGKGTGLGLAMAHGIISKNGGAIDVSSTPGKGTTFDVYWPLVEQE